jgi:hypothetical protein
MTARFFVAAAAGVIVAFASFEVEAFPAAPAPLDQTSMATQIAGGCGYGWHRGRWGGCRRNWRAYGRRCWFRATPWGPRRVCRW